MAQSYAHMYGEIIGDFFAVFHTAFVYAKTASTRRQRCKLYVKSNFINVANHHNVTLGRNMFWHCTNYLHELGLRHAVAINSKI